MSSLRAWCKHTMPLFHWHPHCIECLCLSTWNLCRPFVCSYSEFLAMECYLSKVCCVFVCPSFCGQMFIQDWLVWICLPGKVWNSTQQQLASIGWGIFCTRRMISKKKKKDKKLYSLNNTVQVWALFSTQWKNVLLKHIRLSSTPILILVDKAVPSCTWFRSSIYLLGASGPPSSSVYSLCSSTKYWQGPKKKTTNPE